MSAPAAGRAVLSGFARLHQVTSRRLLTLHLPSGGSRIFQLRLPVNPARGRDRQWSAWHPADFPTEGGGNGIMIRYQLEVPGAL